MSNKKKVVPSHVKGLTSTKNSGQICSNNVLRLNEAPSSVIQQQPQQPREETAITAVVLPQRAEIISVPSRDAELVKKPNDIDGEALGEYIEQHFRGVCTTLRHLLPFIKEMKLKFTSLPREKQADGTYKTIRGCHSFKEWAETKLMRSERAVYYLLARGLPPNEKAKLKGKAAKGGHLVSAAKARRALLKDEVYVREILKQAFAKLTPLLPHYWERYRKICRGLAKRFDEASKTPPAGKARGGAR